MTTYWAEVKRIPGKRPKYKLYALVDSTSNLKPSPRAGGDDLIPITDESYNILRATRGDAARAREVAMHLAKIFELPGESK